MLRIFHLLLFVAFVIGGGASSPYTLAYKASLFFPAIEYQNTGVAPLVTFNTTVEKDGVSKEGKLSYHPFQPVYFVTEKDKSIVTPAADIPAIMVAGIIQTKEFEQNFKRVSLSLDAVLTVSAIGNVAKLKYLKDFASAARLTLAGIELSSTALDLLLNYTDLCVDGELCEALREYNFYLQVGLLSGEALSAIYKSQLKALKLKAAEKYAEKRAKLVAKYGENSKEVKALDEHFGILQGAGSLDDLVSWASKNGLSNLTQAEIKGTFELFDGNISFAQKALLSSKEIVAGKTLPELAQHFNLPTIPSAQSLTPYQARVWYSWRKSQISTLVNRSNGLEAAAKEALEMRNTIRTTTRNSMKDTDIANFLNTKEVNMTWEEAMSKYNGNYEEIIQASMRGRGVVDVLFQIPK